MNEKSSGAVIFRAEKRPLYLVLLYGAGHWDYVKGHIEPGEEEEETLVREAEEEAGLMDLKILAGFKEHIKYQYKRDGKVVDKEVVFYVAQSNTPNIKLSMEHKDYKWLEYEQALKKVTFKTSKDVIKKANIFVKKYIKNLE